MPGHLEDSDPIKQQGTMPKNIVIYSDGTGHDDAGREMTCGRQARSNAWI